MTEKNVHKNHRQRMRAKYEKYGSDAFETHQLLEMLLYHSMRMGDTNPLSHRILNTHPSGGLNACTPSELVDVDGVGSQTANLLCLSADTTLALLLDSLKGSPLSSSFSRKLFMWLWMKNKGEKAVGILLLDKRSRALDCFCISKGKCLRPELYGEAILSSIERVAAKDGVSFVIIAHNHANNDKLCSAEDVYLTGYISELLKKEGIDLAGHYIVTDADCVDCMTEQQI